MSLPPPTPPVHGHGAPDGALPVPAIWRLFAPVPRPRRSRPGRMAFLGATLAAAGVAGALGAQWTAVFWAIGGILAVVAVCRAAYRHPAPTVSAAFFLLPLAGTKFRIRDATASISGQIDAQVIYEITLYAAVGAIAVLAAMSGKLERRRRTPLELLLGVYVAIAIASVAWSLTPALTAVKSVQLGVSYLLCVVAMRVLSPEKALLRVGQVVVPYVLVCALLAAAFPWALNAAAAQGRVARFAWFAVHPNTAATYTAIAVISVYLWMRYGTPRRSARSIIAALAAFVLLLVVLAMTRSRGPALGLAIAMTFLIVSSRLGPRLSPLAVAVLVILMGVYLNGGWSWTAWLREHDGSEVVRFILRGQSPEDIAGVSGRGELWRDVGTLAFERPLFGFGYGGARGLLLDVMPWAGNAHNGMLQSVLDVGVVGSLLLWGALVCTLAVSAFQVSGTTSRPRYTPAAVLAYSTFFLVSTMTDVGFTEPSYMFLLVLVCILALESDDARPGARPGLARAGDGRAAAGRATVVHAAVARGGAWRGGEPRGGG